MREHQLADWERLRHAWGGCTRCGLHTARTNMVIGSGDPCAELVIVGEAPGFHEDQQGEAFVGRAGELLDELLASIRLDRERVLILNVLKCRPPGNRDPQPGEIASCLPLLHEQIGIAQPKAILTLGRFSARVMLHVERGIGRLRGKWGSTHVEHRDYPVMPTYHPAYVLRNGDGQPGTRHRMRVDEDFALVRKALDTGFFLNAEPQAVYQGGPITVGGHR